jgi:predicted AAA+ superfamily ATPase
MTLAPGAHPPASIGPILENLAIGEIARQLTWACELAQLAHYRDRAGYEVDAVFEHESGDVVAVEIKAAEAVRSDDFQWPAPAAPTVGGLTTCSTLSF